MEIPDWAIPIIERWSEDLDTLDVIKAAKKLSKEQKELLKSTEIFLLSIEHNHELKEEYFWVYEVYDRGVPFGNINYLNIKNASHLLHQLRKLRDSYTPGSFSASERASFSRMLNRLELRGLLIRNDSFNIRTSLDDPPPKQTVFLKITNLGRRVAKRLLLKDPRNLSLLFQAEYINQTKVRTENIKELSKKLSKLQKLILSKLHQLELFIENKDMYLVKDLFKIWGFGFSKYIKPDLENLLVEVIKPNKVNIKRSSYSRTIKRLENRGLVIRMDSSIPYKLDKNQLTKYTKNIRLTEIGRLVVETFGESWF